MNEAIIFAVGVSVVVGFWLGVRVVLTVLRSQAPASKSPERDAVRELSLVLSVLETLSRKDNVQAKGVRIRKPK